MVELSLLEKIKIMFDLIFSSSLFFVLFIGILFILVDIFYISRKSKVVKIIYACFSVLIIIGLSINYFKELLNVIHEVNKNIVALINFPTVSQYVTILLVLLLIMIGILFSKKTLRVIKEINIGVFISNLYIFFLILDQISKNKIDLSNKIDIYKHQNLMVLFQLSLFIFIVWSVILIVTKICRLLIRNDDNKNNIQNENKNIINNLSDDDEIEIPKRKEEIINFYEEPEIPVKLEDLKNKDDNMVDLLELQNKVIEGVFTLDEYKEMKKALENIKK